ncbi:MAG: hydrogenase expression/formation protein HypE [Candidatus Omnitrophota bacterium]
MEKILLAHGGGGQKTTELIQKRIHKYFADPILDRMDDAAILENKLVFTTDSFVVNPLFFPGGDIGELAISGTVNDIAVMGAKPLYLSVGFIIEEGFDTADFERILLSMKNAAEKSGIRIVTGDTKVVEKGKCDGIFINTSGIGEIVFSPTPSVERIQPGDTVLINGPIGLHQIAVLTARNEFHLDTHVESDVTPLWPLIRELQNCDIKFMRDPTRGGISQVLSEITTGRDFGIEIHEDTLPITREVAGICEILGFDILHLANEGKVLVIASEKDAAKVLDIMNRHPLGQGAAIIGTITEKNKGMVYLKTTARSERIIMPPTGELVPRIC